MRLRSFRSDHYLLRTSFTIISSHTPPHPTLHQKVLIVSQSVLHRLLSFSTRFASTLRALLGRIISFCPQCHFHAWRYDYGYQWSLSIIQTYLSNIFHFSSPRSCFRSPLNSLAPRYDVLAIPSLLHPLSLTSLSLPLACTSLRVSPPSFTTTIANHFTPHQPTTSHYTTTVDFDDGDGRICR
jgi:hypothetical protein